MCPHYHDVFSEPTWTVYYVVRKNTEKKKMCHQVKINSALYLPRKYNKNRPPQNTGKPLL